MKQKIEEFIEELKSLSNRYHEGCVIHKHELDELIERHSTELLSNAEGEEWISVEERLPVKMQDILFTVVGVKNMNNEPIPTSVHYGWLDLSSRFRSYIDPRDRWLATHWMPLPKAPSQPQKGEGV